MIKKRYIIWVVLVVTVIVAVVGISIYQKINKPNVKIDGEYSYIFIPTGSNYTTLLNIIEDKNILIDKESFTWVAKKKKLENHVHAGRFKIKNGLSNNQLANLLRSGRQEEINLVFNNIRTKEQLAGRIGNQLEADSIDILELFNDKIFIDKHGYDKRTIISLFIPNTYRFFWNTGAEAFFQRMVKENKRFWNKKRLAKLEKIGMTKLEVMTLASIVEEETKKNDEKKRLAGVYINRLKKRWKLQADPTVVYALGDFTIKRVLNKHLEIDSPYNTYKYRGLPPGPINIPSISSIDAVLNFEKHSYLYFCAKEDFSGYHNFSKTLKQHNIYAERYKRALNKMRIYR